MKAADNAQDIDDNSHSISVNAEAIKIIEGANDTSTAAIEVNTADIS